MKKSVIAIIGVIAILVITGIFFIKSKTGNAIKNTEIKEFTVKAFRFGYTPDIINVNKGDRVKINVDNVDVLHGIRIPELNIRGNESLEFTADKTGEFVWYCTNMCGGGHMQMRGKLIVKG